MPNKLNLSDTHVRRIRRLVRVLKKVDERRFNLNSWGPSSHNIHEAKRDEIPSCRTTACAAGWAGLDPVLSKEGFRLQLGFYYGPLRRHRHTIGSVEEFNDTLRYLSDEDHKDDPFFTVSYKGQTDYDACAKFFGLSPRDALSIFSPASYPHKDRGAPAVIQRIKDVTGL